MSSNSSEPRVELTLQARPEMFWGLAAIHLLALAALFAADLAALYRLLLAAMIAASLWRQLATHWRRRTPRAIRRIIWHGDGRWELADGRGTTIGVLTDYYLGSGLILLKFQHHPAVLLWNGAAAAPALRRLRVRLRHGRLAVPVRIARRHGQPSRVGL
ncbi:MAG TPA: hypothetical protein VFK45_04725 [Gammaproteobacteria bacterium]|nr:hypothetical protein [Gammaproteobacteria bacterium]